MGKGKASMEPQNFAKKSLAYFTPPRMDLLFPMTMGVTFFLLNILKNTNDEDTRKLVIFYHLLYHDLFTNCITLIAFKSFCTTTFQSLLLYLDENKEIIPSKKKKKKIFPKKKKKKKKKK